MKNIVAIFLISWKALLNAQVYPEYKIPVPEKVVLNHSCNTRNVSVIYQDGSQSAANTCSFLSIQTDAQANCYFLGLSIFTIDANNPTLTSQITFGSNTSNPQTLTRFDKQYYFIGKYHSDGSLAWVNFFEQKPDKILWNESEQKLYALVTPNNYQFTINGTTYQLNTSIPYTKKVVLTFDTSGNLVNIFHMNSIQDMIIAENKNILIYLNDNSYAYYFGVMYGFFKNNQVVKWQNTLANESFLPTQLYYNPYDHSLWYFYSNSNRYRRLFFHPTEDSLIAENISRNLYYEYLPPYGVLSKPQNLVFTPDNNIVSTMTLYPPSSLYHSPRGLVKWDTTGNLIWKMNIDYDTFAVDNDGNLWLTFNYAEYYKRVLIQPSNKEYYINTYGNIYEQKNFLWKINGSNGELLEAYRNGYGNSLYPNKHLVVLTSNNQLITTPQMGAIAYYPDVNGNFKSYYATCSNGNMVSQFMWASFDLNNLKSYKMEKSVEEELLSQEVLSTDLKVFPNPASNEFSILSPISDNLILYDACGKTIDTITVSSNEVVTYEHALAPGVYFLKGKQSLFSKKIIIL